jgi:hypothetical protein
MISWMPSLADAKNRIRDIQEPKVRCQHLGQFIVREVGRRRRERKRSDHWEIGL